MKYIRLENAKEAELVYIVNVNNNSLKHIVKTEEHVMQMNWFNGQTWFR